MIFYEIAQFESAITVYKSKTPSVFEIQFADSIKQSTPSTPSKL